MSSANDNILRRGEPSRTAYRIAQLRAAHQLLDVPIVLADPIALPILGREAQASLRANPIQYNRPGLRRLRGAVVVRSRFAEDELARAVSAGVSQYVVLGAGLDTFAYRNPFPKDALRVYEVDHPSTQRWKRRLLAEAGVAIPSTVAFVPVDFERETLVQPLLDAGFRPDRPACVSWLGVTMYLAERAVMAVLSFVAGLPRGSSITFDYRIPAMLMNPIERAVNGFLARRVAAIGERWISTFVPSELRQKALALGFCEATAYEPADLNRLYLSHRSDGLRTSGRLLCARV